MHKSLDVGDFKIYWLNGGVFELDAGTMFGVVPKVLWEKKYACGEDNYIKLANNLILIVTPETNIVIETGLGNKLSEKQKKIFRVTNDWCVPQDLSTIGLDLEDIEHVILTHCDFDHAGGVTMFDKNENVQLTFPNAIHYIQQKEWYDVIHPNSRSANTYWPINTDLLMDSGKIKQVDNDLEIIPGIRLHHSGGHTRGHQVIWIESEGQYAVHLGDLLPNHAHVNPLWVTAFDNYPLESVQQKEDLTLKAVQQNAWFLYYHDHYMLASKFNEEWELIEEWGRK